MKNQLLSKVLLQEINYQKIPGSILMLQEVPNKSEVDDILLVYVAKKLIEKEKNIYIVSRDKFNWLDGDLKKKY